MKKKGDPVSRKTDPRSQSDKKHNKKPPPVSDQPSTSTHKYTKFNVLVLDVHKHLKTYITSHTEEVKFQCKGCKKKGFPDSGYYDHLVTHIDADRHRLATQTDVEETNQVIKALKEFRQRKKKEVEVSKEILDEARVDLTLFLLQHELPFSLSTQIATMMQKFFEKYGGQAIKQITLSDKTAATIARETLCKSVKEELFDDLRNNLFSLSFDGGSDTYSGPSYLCTYVRYIKAGKYENRMLSLKEIGKSYTGEALFNLVKSIFSGQNKEALKNLVGVCSDEGSNMVGKEKGLCSRIKSEHPQVYVANDFSHCYNTITKHALRKFNQDPINVVTNICAYFARSSLRRAEFQEIQEMWEDEGIKDALNIVSHVETRWSSLVRSVKRILSLWKPLEDFFSRPGEQIEPPMSPENKGYLEVLACLLEKLNQQIVYFQNDEREYTTIVSKLSETLILTSNLILKKDMLDTSSREAHVKSIIGLPFKSKDQLKPYFKDMEDFQKQFLLKYPNLEESLKPLSQEDRDGCYQSTKDFLAEVLRGMVKKFPYKSKLLENCLVIKLEEEKFADQKWHCVAEQFKNITTKNSPSFLDELERFDFNYGGNQSICKDFKISFPPLQKGSNQYLVHFWNSVQGSYPIMRKLAIACLTLPYSTITIERSFPALRDIKYAKRNRLCTSGLEACLMMHEITNSEEGFEITEDMMEKYKIMWQKIPQEDSQDPKEPEERKEIADNPSSSVELADPNPIQDEEKKSERNTLPTTELHQQRSGKNSRASKRKPLEELSREENHAPLQKVKITPSKKQ